MMPYGTYYEWKEIPDGPIIVDISKYEEVRFYGTVWDVHGALKEAFGFPEYYGENWDALWDLLSDFCMFEEEPREVHIYGWNAMSDKMKELYAEMWDVFADAEKKYPNVKFVLKS